MMHQTIDLYNISARSLSSLLPNDLKKRVLSLPHINLPYQTDRYDQAFNYLKNFDYIYVFGTGGSSLGGQTLTGVLPHSKVTFCDSIDPFTFQSLLEKLVIEKTGCIFISKSGETAETVMQFLLIMQAFEKQGKIKNFQSQSVVITEDKTSTLHTLARHHQLLIMPHSTDIGGRFSAFLNVSLLPARLAGFNINDFRKGAQKTIETFKNGDSLLDAWPVQGALTQLMLQQDYQVNQSVMMPYCDRLYYFTLWFRQLWAESLGKSGKGTTPVHAMGAVDQHSQLQLYLDGPRDKFFTIIQNNHTFITPCYYQKDKIVQTTGLYHTKQIGDLFQAECQATIDTLRHHQRFLRVLTLPELTEQTLGELMMHYILETIIAGFCLQIDPFNQPAVEDGKKRAKAYLMDA